MSAITPTCLPWQTAHDFDIEGRTTIIGNVDGEIIDGTTHHTYDFVARTLDTEDDSQSHSVAVANAEFIVRACNSHAALVEALEQIANWEPRAFEMPSDWHDQIDACEDCQRYSGHPIQAGICDKHRRPLWDRETHDRQQRELRGLYARDIARAAIAKARGQA